MVVEVLAAHAFRVVRIGIIAPGKNSNAAKVFWQEVTQPVDTIGRGPRLLSVAIESVYRNDAGQFG
ncbi:hypothetical protein RRF57_012838 [Xylaria bambusicola]|uniref:Uncharacterized protein n=1 Tax=Xylaria bambusicola TaxID=326684 RepID=A0AAN7V265_9PEZI